MELPRILTESETNFVNSFAETAEQIAKERGVYDDFNIYSIAAAANLNISILPREEILIQAIWVKFLEILRNHIPLADLKYPTIEKFLENYPGCFDDCVPMEIKNLWETANWMNILFRFIPAKKNKGLAIAIIPKVVEGWFTKYVTGSGQKRATADRVRIFETEGDVKPNQRGKIISARRYASGLRSPAPPRTHYTKSNKTPATKQRISFRHQRKKQCASQYENVYDQGVHMQADDDNDKDEMSQQSLDTGYVHIPLMLPGNGNAYGTHDLTDHDTDHDPYETSQGGMICEPSQYELDFESSADIFFNRYEEASMSLEHPDSLEVDTMACEDDIDYTEVIRLLRENSTPNLRSNANSLCRMSSSPRPDFTSPLSSSALACASPMSIYQANNHHATGGLGSTNQWSGTVPIMGQFVTRSVSYPEMALSQHSPTLSVSSTLSFSCFDYESTDEEHEHDEPMSRSLQKQDKSWNYNNFNTNSNLNNNNNNYNISRLGTA